MNDKILLISFVYLLLAGLIFASLPNDMFEGSRPTSPESSELYGDDEIDSSPTSILGSLGFFGRLAVFLFVPIVIDGVPVIIASVLQIIHLLIFISGFIYIAKLIRGVGTSG